MKSFLKRLLPRFILDQYHYVLARFAAIAYGNPSQRMVVIGVTGTNGKSTVVNLISAALEAGGMKVGHATTVNFKVGDRVWLNDTKMTMLGRFRLQRLLREMADAGCTHAVVETSSEGIAQHRHAGIHYDVAVFTNLTPEHIESHGSFENYKAAKLKLFEKLAADPVKVLGGKQVKKVAVANLGDAHAKDFLRFDIMKYGYLAEGAEAASEAEWPIAIVKGLGIHTDAAGVSFTVRDVPFTLALPGVFNVENALAAISVGLSQGVTLEDMAKGLAAVEGVPGRLERIDEGQPFTVMVDYAPEPASLGKLYEVVHAMPKRRVIHVLGSCGGGRDRARRPILGRMAAENADVVIITNEDPYDDDPLLIMREVAQGAIDAGKREGTDLFVVPDRAEALQRAVDMAGEGDVVLATGKGAEQAIVVANGKRIPWDERVTLRNALHRYSRKEV